MGHWFRKSSWSAEDERDFRTRLSRARDRSQYLRIQADELLGKGLAAPALQLFDELLASDPDSIFLTMIQTDRARALVSLKRPVEAVQAFRLAVAAARARPNVRGYAALEFAEFAVAARRADLYSEVTLALDQEPADNPFPAVQFRESTVRAFVAEEQGDHVAARSHAERALAALAATKAPFPRHPGLGLVSSVAPAVEARLRGLCAA